MIIKNFEALAISPLRKQALLIAESGFAAIQTKRAVHSQVTYHAARDRLTVMGHEYALGGVEKVVVVGFGKAAFEAASALYEILDSRITCGYVLDLSGGSRGSLTCTIGTHPFPTVVNVEATKQMVEVLRGLSEKDLVLCVVSGGGSSLLCYPYNMTCEIETRIVQTLMKHGATIEELNTVRKHISQVKGGKLAEVAYPAQIINFIFSDVPGDDPALVASGPTLPDRSTIADARAVLEKYNVLDLCSMPSCELIETPKDEKYFARVTTHVLVSGHTALEVMKAKAEDLGFRARVYKTAYSGEARELGPEFVRETKVGECLLAAGESTVTVKVDGKGGRNLEMALAALEVVSEDQVFIAFDSDGFDNTDFAGAIVDNATLQNARRAGLDPTRELQSNSSYLFFERVGDYISTGLTGSNVADLIISLKQ